LINSVSQNLEKLISINVEALKSNPFCKYLWEHLLKIFESDRESITKAAEEKGLSNISPLVL